MGRFVVRRIAQGLLVVIGVTIMVFIFTRMVGDPAKTMLPLSASAEERAAFRHELGLDQPITQQLADYIRDLASGDFGTSLWQRRPAIDAVLDALPNTLQLVLLAIAIAVLLGVPLGVLAALRPGRAGPDRGGAQPGRAVDPAVLARPAAHHRLLGHAQRPADRRDGDAGAPDPADADAGVPRPGRIAMIVRSSMIDELNQQYVKTAKAKGMPRVRVVGIHALRNASIPALTLTGWELIRALAGYSVVVETVFAWPGVGFLADQALNNQDLILLQAIVFVVAVMVVVINVGVDVLYRAVDPGSSWCDMATVKGREPDLGRRRRRETEHAAQHQMFLRGRPYEVIRAVRGAMGELWSDKAGLFGVGVLVLLVLTAVFALLLAPHDPAAQSLENRLRPPFWSAEGSWDYPLGADGLGRDVLSRMIYGSRVSLIVGASVVLLAGTFGTLMGLIAGYRGGRTDSIIMRVVDTQVAFPGLLVLIILAAIGPSMTTIIVVLAINGWMVYARITRGWC